MCRRIYESVEHKVRVSTREGVHGYGIFTGIWKLNGPASVLRRKNMDMAQGQKTCSIQPCADGFLCLVDISFHVIRVKIDQRVEPLRH